MNKIKLQTGIILSLFLSLGSVYAEVSPETVVDIFQRLETLEKKTRELTGENEVLKHQLGQLKKSQKQGFLNMDERFEELSTTKKNGPKSEENSETENKATETKDEKVKIIDSGDDGKKADAVEVTSTVETPKAVEKEAQVAPNTAKKKIRAASKYERETYQAAFQLMKKSPSAATKAFQEYIKMQPESPLAANAQYWIGEIMYSHNNYKGAVKEFVKVLQKYKYSDKAPDAAIKLGYSFYALKNWAYARRTFDDVIKYFPDNKNAVNLAQRRLAKMKVAGN